MENETTQVADVAAPVVETVKDQVETATPENEEQRPKGVQKRIDELTLLRRQAERDRDHWRELAMRSAQQPNQPEPKAEAPIGKPSLAQFNNDADAYIEALTDWKLNERSRAEAETRKQREQEQQRMATATTLQKAVLTAQQKYEDFADVVGNPSLPLPVHVVEAAVDLGDAAGDVLYYLGSNPDKAAEIAGMSERRAAVALARIEAQLAAKPSAAPVAPQVSKAPPPPAAVGNRAPVAVDPMKLSPDEWRVHRNKELAERNRALRGK